MTIALITEPRASIEQMLLIISMLQVRYTPKVAQKKTSALDIMERSAALAAMRMAFMAVVPALQFLPEASGQQDGIVHRCTQLHTADHGRCNEGDDGAGKKGNRLVDENSELNAAYDDDGDRERFKTDRNDDKDRQRGKDAGNDKILIRDCGQILCQRAFAVIIPPLS